MSTSDAVEADQLMDLLVFEHNLRKEYMELRQLKRKYTAILIALILWIMCGAYYIWIAPVSTRLLRFFVKSGTFIGISALLLFCVSGLYNDTIVEPRKFIPKANRALRAFNVKLVIQQDGWLNIGRKSRDSQTLRLIMSSKAGSIEFREAYEEYRTAYWQQIEQKHDKSQKHDKLHTR